MTIIDGLGVSSLEFQSVWLARLAGPQHADRQTGAFPRALPIEVGSRAEYSE